MLTFFFRRRRLSPLDYGAVGDGVVPDTSAFAAVVTAARSLGAYVYLRSGFTFNLTGYATFLNGDRGLLGEGGTLRLDGAPSGVLLSGKAQGQAENVNGFVLEGVNIDCMGAPRNAIYAPSASNCIFRNNRIFNLSGGGVGIYVRALAAAHGGPNGNLIEHNEITADGSEATAVTAGIYVSGHMDYAPYADAATMWKATHDMASAVRTPAVGNVIRSNRVNGGYYAINLAATDRCEVYDNVCTNNIRNISVQASCTNGEIRSNALSESLSTGIHLAYGSSDNLIQGNTIRTTRGRGEGLLQAYVGCKRNIFRGNVTHNPGPSVGNKWHAYCGIQSDDCVFERNEFNGLAHRAYIAVESAWDNTITNHAHRAYDIGENVSGYAGAGINGVVIEANTFRGTSAVPAIFLSQVNDGAQWPNTGTVIRGNRIIGNAYSAQVELYEQTAGDLSGLVAESNVFDSAADASKFVLPRGRDHFATDTGNNWPSGV